MHSLSDSPLSLLSLPLRKLPTESTSSVLTSRSLSLKRHFIAVVTPALHQQTRIRHPAKRTDDTGRDQIRPAILPLMEVIAKTVPERCHRRKGAMERHRNGGCHGFLRRRQAGMENQQALEGGLYAPWTREEWIGSSPSSPINRLLLDSFAGRAVA